jgi:putative membrane protein
MKNEKSGLQKEQPVHAYDSTQMAVQRTVMAADRSLMAWVRTGLSLISFGFTIYKFLDYSREQLIATGKSVNSFSSPKLIGLFMIGMGILSLIFGTLENVTIIRKLRGEYSFSYARYSLIMAGLLTIFGIIIFFGILF